MFGTPFRDSLYTFPDFCTRAWLGIALWVWGFPEFTSFFNPSYGGELRDAGFEFAMAIGANQNAFV
jgi:hypothetical protein